MFFDMRSDVLPVLLAHVSILDVWHRMSACTILIFAMGIWYSLRGFADMLAVRFVHVRNLDVRDHMSLPGMHYLDVLDIR
jgi:hypothetical protein